MNHRCFSRACLAYCVIFSFTTGHANENNQNNPNTLQAVQVQAPRYTENENHGYAAQIASGVLRSNIPLFEAAQSISVITNQQLEAKQASSITEALQGVAGVAAGAHGRRGWDDFIIRGQISSAQTYIDGLRAQNSTNVFRAEDIAGIESVTVVKGPTSVGFGMSLPGGLVNLTTKRPQAASFYRTSASVGNFGLKEGRFDINLAPHDRTKGAVRIVGRLADQNDPTEHVYFKSSYLASSYSFDLNANNELSIMASWQQRNYMRNQGMPSNWQEHGIDKNVFIGEPDRHYDVDIFRLGSNYAYYFANDWIFKNNLAIIKGSSQTNSVFAASNAKFPVVQREISNQDKQDTNYTLDSYFQHHFQRGSLRHEFTLGADLMRERSDYWQHTDKTNPLDFTGNATGSFGQPQYGITTATPLRTRWNLTHTQHAGLYVRDTLHVGTHWIMGAALRHDWARLQVRNMAGNGLQGGSQRAFTGSTSLMYRANDRIAPYVSHSTSFMPVTATGENGALLSPEKGQQTEVGLKFQALGQRVQGYVAAYTLQRQNVTENDASLGYSRQTGEQTTRGWEAELHAALSAHWQASFTYSGIPTAQTTHSLTAAEVGKRINQVPRHAASLFVQYHQRGDNTGWHANAGLRMPSYTVLDAGVGYAAKTWAVQLGVKNLLDKFYIQGTPPAAHLVTFGSPRSLVLSAKFSY